MDTRKGFYPENVAGSFGVPVEEHRQEVEIFEDGNRVSMAMLTGKRKAEKPEEQENAVENTVGTPEEKPVTTSMFWKQ